MKLRPMIIASILTLPLTANATGWYAGPLLMTGYTNELDLRGATNATTNVSDKDDGNLVVGVAGLIGYDFAAHDVPFSLEFSANWRARHDLDATFTGGNIKSNVETADVMMSALYDIPLGTSVQPYIGGGLGMSWNEADSEDHDAVITDMGTNSNMDFAWQLQGGVKYPLDDSMKLRIDYRYVELGQVQTNLAPGGEAIKADLYSHDVRVGLTWDF